jgi:hypothetical protein
MKRKVVAITGGGCNVLYALCNDGTIWGISVEDNKWDPLPEIPQLEELDD